MTSLIVRTVHDVAGFAAVADYFSDVWHTPRSAPPVLPETLHSLAHAGGAVHAAYDGQRLAGASVAVFGPPALRETYSLMAAAEQGLGVRVKQAQRAWAVELGARTMRWTFDPLVGRNARFNLVKLGAVGTEYLVDFYGPMADGVNDGDETDRLTVAWDLIEPGQPYDSGGTGDREAAPTTHTAPDGGPLARRDPADRYVWCRVPDDVVALRAADPELALHWRRAVREVFTKAFADGFTARGMSRDGWYTLARQEATS
ncbi:chorismate synthase [Streptomyces viridochromogenes]|uniref:Chorismate synthase n=1 Tax=Streptomyces viridochromogenes TaxID=1938 RepID=A0A0J7Z8F5_STRVR|nr:chorismate synthase [Streptomyces viridochromogenes]KMS72471.1 chorismate synthase [Streptomyces viridochromogenes]KOG17572.1 chorismate synthase [Streptomyces viridochromogenes]KOG25770.1 chorismate synthase [Streptomyces viridochromogenes]